MTTPRHEFYETDEKLTLSIFDKGADPEQVEISLEPRKFSYSNGEKTLILDPLKGQIDVEKCDYTIGKVKVEVRFTKMVLGRWGGLVGECPDVLSELPEAPADPTTHAPRKRKDWDGITEDILKEDKQKSSDDDPNAGGDAAVNDFFQKLYKDADDDTRRAMMKSYSESGGTTLSTNWDEVKRERVTVKPPDGSEWKKWAA